MVADLFGALGAESCLICMIHHVKFDGIGTRSRCHCLSTPLVLNLLPALVLPSSLAKDSTYARLESFVVKSSRQCVEGRETKETHSFEDVDEP